MCVWFFLVFGKVGQMTIIGEGMGIQNGMGLLCRNATDTLETFVGSVYRANLTLLTFFSFDCEHQPQVLGRAFLFLIAF